MTTELFWNQLHLRTLWLERKLHKKENYILILQKIDSAWWLKYFPRFKMYIMLSNKTKIKRLTLHIKLSQPRNRIRFIQSLYKLNHIIYIVNTCFCLYILYPLYVWIHQRHAYTHRRLFSEFTKNDKGISRIYTIRYIVCKAKKNTF